MEIFYLVIIIAALGGFVAFVVRGVSFRDKFDEVEIGMTYSQVVSMVGVPNGTSSSGSIKTCVWQKPVLKGVTIIRTVTFEDDKVLHITEG